MAYARARSPDQVVAAALDYFQKLQYAKGSLANFRFYWGQFTRFAHSVGQRRFSRALVQQFLETKGIVRDHLPRDTTARARRAALRMLTEFAMTGRHRYFPSRKTPPALPPFVERAFGAVVDHVRRNSVCTETTLVKRIQWMRRLMKFLLDRRSVSSWRQVTASDLSAYLESIGTFKRKTRHLACQCIKAVFRILFVLGRLPNPLHEEVPRFSSPCEERLQPVWSPTEVRSTLAAIDRNTPKGKRDYAMLLLALRLGLRTCDIRALRLNDLHWDRSSVEIVQRKTGVPLSLPLTPEVGNALIDYLRNGRPQAAHREVFLRHLAPFMPFHEHTYFHNLIERYRLQAGLPERTGCGLHAFRYTLANQLLERGTPLDSIAAVLGHTNPASTRCYLRVSVSSLRQVALDPDREVAHG